MKTSKFVLWQIKKWLPLFIVTALIVLVLLRSDIVLANASTTNMFTLVAFITPLFVFSERFDKGAADAYRAFPANKLQIKRIKILIMLVYLVVLVTVTYSIGVIIYYVSHGSAQSAQYEAFYKYDPYKMIGAGAGSFFMNYLFLVLFTVTTYLFNCTLASLGNFLLTSIIYMSAGTLLISGIVPAFILTFASKDGIETYIVNFVKGNFLGIGGTYGKQFAIQAILYKMYALPDFDDVTFSTASTVILSILFLIELGVGALCFFLKDPSGEHYSMSGARNENHKIILYASFLVTFMIVAFLCGLLCGILPEYAAVYLVMLFASTAIGSYISLVVFNKRFALNKKELIIFSSVVAVGLIITIVSYFRISSFVDSWRFINVE